MADSRNYLQLLHCLEMSTDIADFKKCKLKKCSLYQMTAAQACQKHGYE